MINKCGYEIHLDSMTEVNDTDDINKMVLVAERTRKNILEQNKKD